MNKYQVRVYFEDTDCGSIVYHTNYLKYCERARSELFFSKGREPFVGDCGFVLKHIEADFIASAKLGDLLEVRSEVVCLKNVSVVLHQRIYKINCASKAVEQEIFNARITLAFVDALKGKLQKITPEMLEILHHI